MLFQTKTRRNAIAALVAVCLLVCGGLGWATVTGLRLESIEAAQIRADAEDIQEKSNIKTLALSLSHLDGIVDSTLAAERTRPFEHFRAWYKPAGVVDLHNGLPMGGDILVRSPLRDFNGPDWELLHFQVSFNEGWSSPQLEQDNLFATPAGAIPAVDRAKQASAENWLAALRERCDPFTLLHLLETAEQAERNRSDEIANLGAAGKMVNDRAETPRRPSADPMDEVRTAAEFARRGQRLVELQRAHLPAEQCEPVDVAFENLQTGEQTPESIQANSECVKVSGTPMRPVWLDLTLDGRRQLALVRSVSVEQSQFCTLQGVLIDWELLRKKLEDEVQELMPGAKLEPVEIGAPFDPTTLRTIPARLVGALPTAVEFAPATRGMTWGLVLTWTATLLALAALCYGTMKYVSMLERRMQFVAAVTHELRTPLTSFQIYTDLLADLGDNTDRRRQYVETLRGESKRLARLVENVLVYSKIGDDRPHLNRRSVSPLQVLEALAIQMKGPCMAAGKELVIDDRCGPGHRIDTDFEFVLQILANLVENACKYSAGATDPRIWLTAKPWDDQGVAFEVEDFGEGVAHSDRRAIFKPFRRGSSAPGGGKTGMGLGLALSRYWAMCLGGRLELKRGEHNGAQYTRFSLCIPSA